MSLEETARKLAAQAKQASDASTEFNPDQERDRWLQALNKMYDQIVGWLQPLEGEGLMQVSRTEKTLSEQFLGTYAAPSLNLGFGHQTIIFNPRGTMFIGCHGRVDVFRKDRPQRDISLIMHRKDDNETWQLSYAKQRYKPFNEDVIRELLEALLKAY